MEQAVRMAAAAVAAVLLALLLKKSSPEMSMLLSAAAAVTILVPALGELTGIRAFIDSLAEAAAISPAYISPVVKSVGIGLVTHFASDVCRDCGQSAVCSAVEAAGTLFAVCAALPLMRAVFGMISSLL